jgi:hypothetical protein
MHGGADGSGAPKGERNGNFKHDRYTQEVAATHQWLREANADRDPADYAESQPLQRKIDRALLRAIAIRNKLAALLEPLDVKAGSGEGQTQAADRATEATAG